MSQILSLLFLEFLLPGTVESLMRSFESQGNMGMTGIYKGIYAHRNLVWFSLFLWPILFYLGYFWSGFVFVLVTLIKYYFMLKKWCRLIDRI